MTFTRTYPNRTVHMHERIPVEWCTNESTFTLPEKYEGYWLRYYDVLAVVENTIIVFFLHFTYTEDAVQIDPITMWDFDHDTLRAFDDLAEHFST